jgi:hypothetical protein
VPDDVSAMALGHFVDDKAIAILYSVDGTINRPVDSGRGEYKKFPRPIVLSGKIKLIG